MNNRFFSKGIFWEQFKELKIVGIIGSVLYSLLGIFVSLGFNFSDDVYYAGRVIIMDCLHICLFQIVIPLIFVPVLALAAFHFLTKRSSSDFYHALPVKREAMYTGILAAVLAWAFIITVLPVIVMWVVCLPLRTVEFSFLEAFKAILNTLVSCLFMTGVMALGINLSGTLFTNIVSSGIILVVPRIILIMCFVISNELMENYVFEYYFLRLMMYGNPITKLFYVWGLYDWESFTGYYLLGLTAGVIEGLVYILAGGLFFKFRKSEAASMSSVSRVVQSAIRHVLALIFSTIASVFLAEFIWKGYSDELMIFMAVLFYVLAIVVYFLYELITTRKWKSVAKSVRQLPVFVGITAAIFIIISVLTFSEKNYRINVENAEYVKVFSVSRFRGDGYFLDDSDLPVEIHSTEVKKLIADAYNNGENRFYGNMAGELAVEVKENGIKRIRYVYLDTEELISVLSEIYDTEDIDIEQKLPEFKSGGEQMQISLYWNIEEPCALTADEIGRIYDTLRREILGAEEPIRLFVESRYGIICTLNLNTYHNYYDEIPVSYATPQTLSLVQSIIKEHNEVGDFAELAADALENRISDMDMYMEMEGRFYFCSDSFKGTKQYAVPLYYDDSDTLIRRIYDIISKYSPNGDVSGENVVIESSFWYYGGYLSSFGVYNLSDDDIAELWSIFDEQYEQ